jgi:hypothetical protein
VPSHEHTHATLTCPAPAASGAPTVDPTRQGPWPTHPVACTPEKGPYVVLIHHRMHLKFRWAIIYVWSVNSVGRQDKQGIQQLLIGVLFLDVKSVYFVEKIRWTNHARSVSFYFIKNVCRVLEYRTTWIKYVTSEWTNIKHDKIKAIIHYKYIF